MQDPNNPNQNTPNSFPIPPNDAPATFGGGSSAPVTPPPMPNIPNTASVTAPLPVPVVSPEPIAPVPFASPVHEVSSAPAYVAPVIQPIPVDPYVPQPAAIAPQPYQEPVQSAVAEPVSVISPGPILQASPVVSQVQPSISETQSVLTPAQPIVVDPQPVLMPTPIQPVPVEPQAPLSAAHFPEPISSEPIMPEMAQSPVAPAPVMQPVPVSQPSPQPVYAPPPPSILTPTPAPVVQPVVPVAQAVPAASIAPAFAKKKNPMAKIALIAAAILLVLSGILFAVMQFMGSGSGSTVGTKGEITWWGVSLDESDVAPIISDYTASHPDIKITYVKQSKADYRERLTNALAKGAGGPDIFEMHNSWQPMFKNDLSTVPSSIMTPDEFKGTFYPVIVQDMTTTKGIIGMPLYYDALTLYVNEDIFSVALKTAPKTWIDVQNLANPTTGITQKDSSGKIIQSAIALGTTDNVDYWPDILGLMMYQNKASFTNFELQQTKDTLAFYQYFGKTTGNWDSTLPKSIEAFAKGKTAMMIAPASAVYGIIQSAPTLHFKTYNLPQLPKENPTDPDISYATYWSESVWAKSASKDAAWEFLKYASSGEAVQKTNQNLKTNSKPQRAYAIPSLNQQFVNDPILGSVVALAPVAKSWYLADQTNDGKTGLNTQLSTAFATAFTDPKNAQPDVIKILNQYGIVIPK